jgi:hypothetical protein
MNFYNFADVLKTKSNFDHWDRKNEYLQICQKWEDQCFEIFKNHKFQTAGIFYAEAYAFLCFCKLYDVDIIIESGMARGNSTELFLKLFCGDVYTFEHSKKDYHEDVESRLNKYKNLKGIIYEDSRLGIEKIVKANNDKKIAIFIDGPKDVEAVTLLKNCFKNKNVIFGGIHDICNPVTKMRENYDFMKYFEKNHILSTDEESFRSLYKYMDDIIEDENGAWVYNKKGVSEHSLDKTAIRKRFPRGPGIGIAINNIK